ncbi:MAG: DHA1 family tetracycline resistance protein-like MFS transporter [Bacteroidia bacterium]|jgi:DHA1 family tetracycline resistance protein-like MFS transporter
MKNKPALGVIFLTTFLDLLGFGLIIPILPTFAEDLGASDMQIGLIAAIYALMNFSFSPFWGRMSDRHGRRPIILTSILITASAYLIFSQTETIIILILSRIFSGIGSANIGAAQAYIGDITEPKDRAKSMGFIGAAFGLGFVFGPPIGGFLKADFGIEILGYVVAGLSLVNFIVAYFFLPESLKEKNINAKRTNIMTAIMTQLKKPDISRLFFINLIFISAFSMMQVTAVLLWSDHSFFNEKQIGFVFMFIGISSALVQGLLVGRIAKRFGEKQMLTIGLSLLAVGLFAMPFFQDDLFIPWELMAIGLIALANGFINPALMSLITKMSKPNELGQLTGLYQSFGSIGRVLGPAIGGAIYGVSYYLPYIVGPLLLIIGFVLSRSVIIPVLNIDATTSEGDEDHLVSD